MTNEQLAKETGHKSSDVEEIIQHAADRLCKYDWPQSMFDYARKIVRSAVLSALERVGKDSEFAAKRSGNTQGQPTEETGNARFDCAPPPGEPGSGHYGPKCSICNDLEPFHAHDADGKRVENYFTVGRGMEDITAARMWKDRALESEEKVHRILEFLGVK